MDESPRTIEGPVPCIRCGYDLRGTAVNGSCPECGASTVESLAASRSITKREVAVLAVRIMALWFVVDGLLNIIGNVGLLISEPQFWQGPWLISMLAQEVAMLAVGVGLWYFAETISRWMIHRDGCAITAVTWTLADLMQVATCILGLVLLVEGGAGLFTWVIMLGIGGLDSTSDLEGWSPVVSVFYVVFGLILIAGRRRISQWLHKARTAGTPQA